MNVHGDACRFPGCKRPPTVTVDDDEQWCSTHARGEADKRLRQYVMERDRRICQRCGGGAHDAAHLIPRARAPFLHWQPFNVVALCRPCHQALDGSPASREIWAEARWPGRLQELTKIQNHAERWGLSVELGDVIADLRNGPPDAAASLELTPSERRRYQDGTW